MNFELCYPCWKEKALTFSYDDGQIFDRRLVEILDKYGLKATFHLNSGILDADGFVTLKEITGLYQNHEIACHGARHEYPTHLAQERLVNEYYQDRLELERLCKRVIRGCSYAFGEYDDRVIATLRSVGIVYSRTVESAGGFRVPEDFMKWAPTCHHNTAFDSDLAERFLEKPLYERLRLFCVWGHSFELERENTWEKMEAFCEKMHGREEVWYTTCLDYADYMTAARRLIFSADGTRAENPSKIKIYAKLDGECRIL